MALNEEWRVLIDRKSERIGVIYPDVLSEVQNGQVIFSLEVQQERYWSKVPLPPSLYNRPPEPEDEEDSRAMVMGLALVRYEEHAGGYKRVGLVRWMRTSCFYNMEVCEISIY